MEMRGASGRHAIFGGTFDPVHIGHLIVADHACREFSLQRVVFMPAHIPPHKGAPRASARQRLEMLRIAVEDNPLFEVSDLEISRPERSYTYDTVRILKPPGSQAELFFIIGEDAFRQITTWHRIEELVREVTFLVAPRDCSCDAGQPPPFPVSFRALHSPRIEISSTGLRQDLASGGGIRYRVPDRVLRYIEQENPYGPAGISRAAG